MAKDGDTDVKYHAKEPMHSHSGLAQTRQYNCDTFVQG